MIWRRVFGLIFGLSLLSALFSTTPAPTAEAHNPAAQSIEIVSCTGLQEKLNQVHNHDVVTVHSCQWVERMKHFATVVEFDVYNGSQDAQGLPSSITEGPKAWFVSATGKSFPQPPTGVIKNLAVFRDSFGWASFTPCDWSPNSTADIFGDMNWTCSSERTLSGAMGLNGQPLYKDLKIKIWLYFSVTNPPPTVQLAADPAIISPGQDVTLSWVSTNATSLSIDNGIGNVTLPSGSKVAGPINQDTTYKITATGPGGTVDATATVTVNCSIGSAPPTRTLTYLELIKQEITPEPAQAQSPCLPDLKLDATGIQIKLTDRDGRSYAKSLQNFPAGIGYDIKKIEISGVKIKNAGNALAAGKTCYTLWHLTLVKEKYNKDCSKTEVALNLPPGQSMVAPTITIPFGGPYEIEGALNMINRGKTNGLLTLTIDPMDTVREGNEGNNSYVNENATTWAAIKVVLNAPISRAVVRFSADNGSWPQRASVTNPDGVAFLVPTESLHTGPKKYRIAASLGSQSLSQDTPITIDKYGLTIVRVSVKNVLVIKLFPKIEFSPDSSYGKVLPATAGQATIRSQAHGRTYTAEARNGNVVFRPDEVLPGKYNLLRASAQYKDTDYYKEVPLSFEWPEKTRDETGGLEINFNSPLSVSRFMLLGKQCGTLVAPSLAYCVYNDTVARKYITETNMPLVRQVADRMLKWPRYAPTALKEYIFSPDPGSGAYYNYYGRINPEVVMNSEEKSFQEVATYHELFHLIDDYASDSKPDGPWLTEDSNYRRSLDNQLASATGKKLWDYFVRPEAYGGIDIDGFAGGYSAADLLKEGSGKYSEAFAEEKSATCAFRQRVIARLNDATNYWQSVFGNRPPSDLIAQRDNALNRMKGLLPDKNGKLVKNTTIATLHQQCLTK